MRGNVRRSWRLVAPIAVLALGLGGFQGSSIAAGGGNNADAPLNGFVTPGPGAAVQSQKAVLDYWTPERMASAQVHPGVPAGKATKAQSSSNTSTGIPGFTQGSMPSPQFAEADDAAVAQAGSGSIEAPSALPQHNGSYPPPFSRWLPFGKFTNYPLSTIDKMFFSQRGGNFVCSASQVGVDRVLTAGHCIHEGGTSSSTGWSTNILFCPSYNAGGVNPNRGCWAVESNGNAIATSTEWFANGNFDRDWGGAETRPTGTILNAEIGNVTGWLGRAWNFNDEAVLASGYPAAAPFTGSQIIQCASSDWYNQSWGAGADSKYIGCDMTGGSSGGPWVLKWGRPGQPGGEAGNWADGVNSHKRCTQAGCPAGSILVDEMGSPPFTTEAGGSEDFFTFLFGL